MPDPLSPETLAEIEARCEAATPGPWDFDHNRPHSRQWDVYQPTWALPDGQGERIGSVSEEADAAFIAAARTDVPTLLAEVRRQAAEIERLNAEREWRPIRTSPKDGTWILGMNDLGNCAIIIRSQNAMRRKSYIGDAHLQFEIGEGWIMPFTFGEVSPFWEDSRVQWWMPLPSSRLPAPPINPEARR